jgi:hypothetical protein
LSEEKRKIGKPYRFDSKINSAPGQEDKANFKPALKEGDRSSSVDMEDENQKVFGAHSEQVKDPNSSLSVQVETLNQTVGKLESYVTQITSLNQTVAKLESYITQLRSDNLRLLNDNKKFLSDLSLMQGDLRTLHPLPYARLHLKNCSAHQQACKSALIAFSSQYSSAFINSDPVLASQLQELKNALKASIIAQASAAFLCKPPPTLASVLWLIAKIGHSKDLMRCLNLNRATCSCKMLQTEMMEVKSLKEGMTQLNYYSWKGMTNSVKRMLTLKGINVEAGDKTGYTPLIAASLYGQIKICKILLSSGASMSAKMSDGFTALHAACQSGNLAVVALLVNKGAPLEAQSSFDSTPIHIASTGGNVDVCKFLLDKGAKIDSKDNYGRMPIHFACQEGHVCIVNLIIMKNADLEVRTTDGGITPLHFAAMNGKIDIIRALADRGVNLNSATNTGVTALDFCKLGNFTDCANELFRRGAFDSV